MTRQKSRPTKPKKGKVMNTKEYTYTTDAQWQTGNHKLGPIPRSPEGQIELLEHAVYELYSWLMDELGWDNPASISDCLTDQVNQIAHRAYEKSCFDNNMTRA